MNRIALAAETLLASHVEEAAPNCRDENCFLKQHRWTYSHPLQIHW